MAWFTIEEAAQRGPGRRVWRQRIHAGEVKSYVDSVGRTLLWIEESQVVVEPQQMVGAYRRVLADVAALREEVARLRQEVTELRRELRERPAHPAPTVAVTLSSSATIPRVVAPEPAPAPTETQQQRILRQIEETWTGSDRELERRSGIPKAFLAKAKKGLRNGPRSQKTWDLLEAFFAEQAV